MRDCFQWRVEHGGSEYLTLSGFIYGGPGKMATGSLNSLAKCTMVGVFTQGGETVFSLAQVYSSDYNTLILRITCNAHGKDGLLRSCKLAYFSTTDVTRGYINLQN